MYQSQLMRIETIKNEICKKYSIAKDSVEISWHPNQQMPVVNYGNRSRTIISFNQSHLEFLNQHPHPAFLEAYEDFLNQYDISNLKSIQQSAKKLSTSQIHAFLGLHHKLFFYLNDNELYFILKHEILGHTVEQHNFKRITAIITSALISSIVLPIIISPFVSDFTSKQLIPLAGFIFLKILFNLLTQQQELIADEKATENDDRAFQGALRLFKKACITEIIKKHIDNKASNGFVHTLLKELGSFLYENSHPTHQKRLHAIMEKKNVHKKTSSYQNLLLEK